LIFLDYLRQAYDREEVSNFELMYNTWDHVLTEFKGKEDNLVKIFKCFKEAADLDSSLDLVYNTWGHVLAIFDQYRLALVHFEKAMQTEKSRLAIPRHNMGFSNYYLATELEKKSGRHANYEQIEKMHHDAIKYFDQAIKIELHLYQSWYYKGRVFYIGLRQYEEALKIYDISLQINPKFPLVWYDKGLIYAKLERYEEAIECYENAIKLIEQNQQIAATKTITKQENLIMMRTKIS
jgi:tetratricopeptide (TPR) repeat protein